MNFAKAIAAAALVSALAACEVTVKPEDGNASSANASETLDASNQLQPMDQGNPESLERARQLALQAGSEQQRAQARQQALQEMTGLRFEVDISDRKLRMFQGGQIKATHDVAVGTSEWPTPTGSWEFHRVDLNPEWVPPKDEEWAKDEERKAPGAADNPMGRARLVYRMPNTVHGTDDLDSLGKASSHGSIRVANEVAIQLAEILLKAGGSWEGPQWFRQMTQNRTEEYQVPLQQHIPIKVQE